MTITNEPMSNHTSLKVGGSADLYVMAASRDQLISAYTKSAKNNMSIFILGGGTNILVGDKGIRGAVVKNNWRDLEIGGTVKTKLIEERKKRNQQTIWRTGLLNWDDLGISSATEGIKIKVSSGYSLPLLISETLKRGITGLELFSGIPGTVGGAVWNNIHGADWFFGDFLDEVEVCNNNGNVYCIKNDRLSLEYNDSYFHTHDLLIVSATLNLFLGDVKHAKETSKEWIKRKTVQPKNSAGCIFSNITEEEKIKAGLDNLSVGYIIDKVLGLRGYQVGQAKISESHANFIETFSGAKASHVVAVIDHVKNLAKEKLGLNLIEEIVRVGEF
ncbi:hypothetical protein COT49_02575 [candidate division WWE3 bacterium CG08_land_8_20_14_0_20_40_13]|uniref:UDP-N-acetylenolpyruvoylglucosamine reductase n=1 Tax=candidate division WWE3 bacterium CG08_land_8_20_14_0_20_40_13 TaxID=1975084 RepID=A0A2H0XDD1_UNCKA|nr:MAG: hypothetical protein COT49_02575 [candidate division WWE3 bacterium CG08_land_8_20_14_0_20_40_13]